MQWVIRTQEKETARIERRREKKKIGKESAVLILTARVTPHTQLPHSIYALFLYAHGMRKTGKETCMKALNPHRDDGVKAMAQNANIEVLPIS